MKRKREYIEGISPIPKDLAEETNVNKTSTHLNLKSVCTITQPSELTSGFCLQSTSEYILLRSKSEMNLMKFERNLWNHQTKFCLSSVKFPCANYNVVETLKINDKKIFNMASHSQKNDIMLNSHLNPCCVLKNIQVVKSLLSPSRISQTPILASLSSYGSIEISKISYDHDNSQNSREVLAELCEIRKSQFSLGNTYMKLEKLQEIFKDLTFRNFDWCPEFIGSLRFIAAVTKNNELVIFSISYEGEVLIQHDMKFDIVISSLKWFVHKEKHFLIIATSKGDLARYDIELNDVKIESLKIKDEMKGKLKIHTSHIEVDSYNDSIVVICVKAHSLELFLINGEQVSSITKYIGLSVTGITRSSLTHAHYLVTSMCNNTFFMDLAITDNELKIASYENVDNSISPEIIHSKYSAYGITTSKNKVLVFIALYPRIMFDHLVLKQPLCLSVNILSTTDPYNMLLKNPTFKLTGLYDCVEAVRHIAINNLETLAPLEAMSYKIGFSEEFLYFLKIQLIANEASMTFYQTRSESFFEMFKTNAEQMRMLIETINAYFLIRSIALRKEKHSNLTQTSIRCLKAFIESYIQVEFVKEPLKTAKEALTNELKGLFVNWENSSHIEAEKCNICQEELNEGLVCRNNHEIVRCVITKLQLPLCANNFCSNCQCSIHDLLTLKTITEREEFFCPFCDCQFLETN